MYALQKLALGAAVGTYLALGSTAILRAQAIQVGSEAQREQIVARGIEFLRTKGKDRTGCSPARRGRVCRHWRSPGRCGTASGVDDPMVAKGLKALESFVKPDGGIYAERLKNYETCVAIVAFEEANVDGRYDTILANADKYVRGLQYGPGRDTDPEIPGTAVRATAATAGPTCQTPPS